MSEPRPGWVSEAVAAEFPRLGLVESVVAAAPRASPPEVRARLEHLSSRVRGANAVALRQTPVPAAYRAFFRQVGLDPDRDRPPGEAAILDRLIGGGFRSAGLVPDACTIAVVETGVPVWALDDAALDGPLGVRPAADGERLGTGTRSIPLPAGRLAVADARRLVGVLFGELADEVAVRRRTTRIRLFSVLVAGVPDLHAEEALWSCAELLGSG